MEWKPKGKPKMFSFAEIQLNNQIKIGIFQGAKGQRPDLDIVVKYIDPSKSRKVRTPKHIHWVIDLLIKKQHNKELTIEFISYLRGMWDKLEPLRDKNDQQSIINKLSEKEDLRKFVELNNYGEYGVDFIAYIIELFVIEEKTGFVGAFMFKDLFDALLGEKDIFYVVSKATHNGRF